MNLNIQSFCVNSSVVTSYKIAYNSAVTHDMNTTVHIRRSYSFYDDKIILIHDRLL